MLSAFRHAVSPGTERMYQQKSWLQTVVAKRNLHFCFMLSVPFYPTSWPQPCFSFKSLCINEGLSFHRLCWHSCQRSTCEWGGPGLSSGLSQHKYFLQMLGTTRKWFNAVDAHKKSENPLWGAWSSRQDLHFFLARFGKKSLLRSSQYPFVLLSLLSLTAFFFFKSFFIRMQKSTVFISFFITCSGFGKPPAPQYSGFLDAGSAEPGTKLHYWFALADVTASDKPVVLWLSLIKNSCRNADRCKS